MWALSCFKVLITVVTLLLLLSKTHNRKLEFYRFVLKICRHFSHSPSHQRFTSLSSLSAARESDRDPALVSTCCKFFKKTYQKHTHIHKGYIHGARVYDAVRVRDRRRTIACTWCNCKRVVCGAYLALTLTLFRYYTTYLRSTCRPTLALSRPSY